MTKIQRASGKLAYDVGAHDGSDTARYLDLGYSVIAIEASPIKCDKLQARFEREVSAGRCKILNIGVSDRAGKLPFFLSQNSLWSSFDRSMAERNGCTSTEIKIDTRRLGDVIREHGEPAFVKIDVEGSDYACIRTMDARPEFISYEASEPEGAEMIMHLASLGYTQFSLVDQYSSRPVKVPAPGTLSHLKWSLRQLIRLEMRKRPYIHTALTSLRRKQRKTHVRPKEVPPALTPMEHADGWYTPGDFVWLWRSIVTSGIAESSWFDIHVRT